MLILPIIILLQIGESGTWRTSVNVSFADGKFEGGVLGVLADSLGFEEFYIEELDIGKYAFYCASDENKDELEYRISSHSELTLGHDEDFQSISAASTEEANGCHSYMTYMGKINE